MRRSPEPVGPPGRIVVATTPDRLEEVTSLLATLGGVEVRWVLQSVRRVVVSALLATEQLAGNLVTGLRARGELAVVAPTAPGHETAWRKRTSPVWFGDGACVCPPWAEFDRSLASLVVEIDPGRGFGSGAHPSTILALDAIVTRLRPGQAVLDVGCGSGVLGVTAALLGAGSVTAVDIAEDAVAATTHNAWLNGVADRIEVSGAALTDLSRPFDLVVANIAARVLVDLAPDLGCLTERGGSLVLSGMSPAQTSVVAAAHQPLEVVDTPGRGEWAALILTRTEVTG